MAAVLCLGLAGAFPLQAQELDWATRAGGIGFDQGSTIATDDAGNSYVTGSFHSTATFGAGEANETTLTAAGFQDIFIAKYDPNGSLVWAKHAGAGGSFADGRGIAADDAGNSYVTGFFSGTSMFGPGDPNQTFLTSAGGDDAFVAKYDPSGALVWANRAGGSSSDNAFGIATDGPGNSYVTGEFVGIATFGAGEANETTLTSAGQDMFVATYDPSGALVWAERVGGGSTSSANGRKIATDSAGNNYVTGFFSGTVTFGAGEANETTLTAAANRDIFIARYDSSGTLVWAKRESGIPSDQGSGGITTDSAGNSYVIGFFEGTATFGTGEANETTFVSAGGTDVFVARYDPSGALVWAKRAGGPGGEEGLAIAMDSAGNSYVTGFFFVTATFGAGESNETVLTAAFVDIFIAKYDSSGALVWAKREGGAGPELGVGIATDSGGNSYVTGQFNLTAMFGAGEANETTLSSAGSTDIFVAKFSGVPDTDGDGIADGEDNCPDDANSNQLDTDLDGDGDACDADDDNDNVADTADNCPLDANQDQADADGDGAGNACDADLDGDGVVDAADACVPTQTGAVVNADGCSIDDLVPCDSPWKNHGAYVSTIVKTAKEFLDLGLITEAERADIVTAAGQSQCGQ